MDACENCGRTIGKLETPHVFENHVVCGDCLGKLTPRTLEYSIGSRPSSATVQTIEATSKRWKLFQVLGVVGIVIGAVTLGVSGGNGIAMTLGMLFLSGGIVLYFVGRVSAWWYNG
jgi:hypothetical protein